LLLIFIYLFEAHPAQQAEMSALKTFALERGFEGELQPWDVPYWKRKQQRSLFE
jgi:Zn-dependent oligopeptidase